MSITITDDDADGVAAGIGVWRKSIEEHLRNDDTSAARDVQKLLFGAERVLQTLGLADLARLARAAYNDPIATEQEETQ